MNSDEENHTVSADVMNGLEGAYPFLSELVGLRSRARRHIQAVGGGSIEAGKPAQESGQATILELLNEALAAELTCVARYHNHAVLGELAAPVKDEFLKYAREEQGHADRLAERIRELGGQPRLLPESAAADVPGTDAAGAQPLDAEAVIDMLEEDLIAERIAIDCYREMLQFVGGSDALTRQLLENILAVEVEHARELSTIRSELLRRDRSNGSTGTSLPQLDLLYA